MSNTSQVMPDFVFEIFSEELPARMQAEACRSLKEIAVISMQEHGLSSQRIETHVTPRRLALLIEKPQQNVLRKKGPSVQAGEKALDGFCGSLGLQKEQCFQEETAKGVFWMADIFPSGGLHASLAGVCQQCLRDLSWPVRMRWGSSSFTWPRPLRSLLCLYQDEVLSWTFDPQGLGLQTGRRTHGHRFGLGRSIDVSSAATYLQSLKDGYVMLDAALREKTIQEAAQALATEQGYFVFEEDFEEGGLIEEVVGLTEWPLCLLAHFDSSFLQLPEAIITTTLRQHQRYFPLKTGTGKLASSFIVTTNVTALNSEIQEGHQRVVEARLKDALFFWNKDLQHPLISYNEKLRNRLFFEGLGTLHDKVERIVSLAPTLSCSCPADLVQALRLSKADLGTDLVGEFPSLQGTVGRYYAEKQGISGDIAVALQQQYAFKNLDRQSALGGAVALLDHMDTLVGFFASGRLPSGSKDPMALRRSAFTVVRLLMHHQYPLTLSDLISNSLESYQKQGYLGDCVFPTSLLEFCTEKFYSLYQSLAPYLKASLDLSLAPFIWHEKAVSLKQLLETLEGQEFLQAYRRLSSFLSQPLCGQLDPARFECPEETQLWALTKEPFRNEAASLSVWTKALHAFFDQVHVMDPVFKENRLHLLASVADCFATLGHLSML